MVKEKWGCVCVELRGDERRRGGRLLYMLGWETKKGKRKRGKKEKGDKSKTKIQPKTYEKNETYGKKTLTC